MAGEISTQELVRALQALAKQSTSMSNNIKTASEIIAEFTDPIEQSTKEYEAHVKKMRDLHGKEAAEQAKLIGELKKHQLLNQREADARTQDIKQLQADILEKSTALVKQRALAKSLQANYGLLDDATANAYAEVDKLTAELKAATDAQANSTVAQKKHTDEVGKFTSEITAQERALNRMNIGGVVSKSMQQFGSSITKKLLGLIPVMNAVDLGKKMYTDINKEIATGINAASSASEYTRLASLGMDAGKFTDLAQQNRTALIASGGKDAFLDVLTEAQQKFKGLIPFGDRAKFAAEQMSILTSAGIKPTADSLGLLYGSFTKLRKTAGTTGEEFNQMMASVVQSEETIQVLRGAASEQERQAIVAGIAARLAENKAIGVSKDQAIAMVKAQAKMQGEGPLKKYIKGIRTAALGSVLGVEGGDRYMEIQRKSVKDRTADDIKFESDYNGRLSAKTASAYNGGIDDPASLLGVIGQEKLGNENTGPNSVFNISLAKVATSNDALVSSLGEVSNVSKTLVEKLGLVASQLTNNPILQGVVMAVSGLASVVSMLAAGRMASAAGMGGGIRGLGGLGGAGKGALKGAGKSLLTKLPLLGGLVAGGFALNDLANGDMQGAASNAGAGIGSVAGGALGALLAPVTGGLSIPIGAALGGAAGGYLGGKIMGGDSPTTISQPTEKVDDILNKQIRQMDDSNMYLKQLADTMPKLVALSEKQLIAMTLTDQQRTSESTRAKLLGNSRFNNQYQTV
jgi:hypothetical protein